MANAALAYDYYQSTFHRSGFDGSNRQMKISVGDVFGEDRINAASRLDGSLTFCADNNISLETVIHEYTHSVERTISGMVYSEESGALMEAYSDIMGCLGNRDSAWHFDESLFSRNLADPAASKHPSAMYGQYWKAPIDDPKDENDDKGYVHTNCTVIGHAAYLMNKNGISMDNLEQIWYHSLYYLSPTADFKTCRNALIAAADNLDYDEATLSIIRAAFSESGVNGSDRFVLVADDADVQVLEPEGNLVQDASVAVFSLSDDATIAEFDLDSGEFNLKSIPLANGYDNHPVNGQGYCIQVKDAGGGDSPPVSVYVFVREKGMKRLTIEVDFGKMSSDQPEQATIPDDAVAYKGHRYKIYSNVCDSWEAAKEYCELLGGHLAVIEDEEENRFLYDLMRSENCETAYFGFTDSAEEGLWEWVQGASSSYTNWSSGEPNDEGGNEDYGMFYYKSPAYTWNDGNFCDGTVNDKPNFICEWEGAGESASARKKSPYASAERDVVLVLDTSGSMSGKPLEETRIAANKFVGAVLENDARVALATYSNDAETKSDFSTNDVLLQNKIDGLDAVGGTNTESGLQEAMSLLSSSKAGKKIIVLMTDGEANAGKTGDALVEYADSIKDQGVYLYTLGFFDSLGGSKSESQRILERMANEGCHYEVAEAGDLKFFFNDIADQINGTRFIYVRIACPVDVQVEHEGQMLSSSEATLNTRTDFGSLTFEEAESKDSKRASGSSVGQDETIKILRLREGPAYGIAIRGTGSGSMDYVIGFVDDSGEYSDMRVFEDISITDATSIDTTAEVSDLTKLRVDTDGDGSFDQVYSAGVNEKGVLVDNSWISYLVVAGCALIAALAAGLYVRCCMKKRWVCPRCGWRGKGAEFCGECGSSMK